MMIFTLNGTEIYSIPLQEATTENKLWLIDELADLEDEMLEKINELGIGPQGIGGRTTAIGLNIETYPTHIAGMPCAVNINCHVTRHKTEII